MVASGTPTFTLEVVTPERIVFTGPVTTVVAPAADGALGILAHHAPLVATLVPGTLVFRDPSGSTTVLRSHGGGFLEVFHNRVTVLADRIAA